LRLIVLSLAGSLTALAACSEPASTDAVPAEAPAAPPADSRPAPATPDKPATPAPAGECGAAERQDWVGRARSDLPSAPLGALWRIYETGQPVTQDLRHNRLNIEIDPEAQTVVRLTCG
jgi:hypothetical protein